MARTWPIPEARRTVHFIGDIHFHVRAWMGWNNGATAGLWRNRWDKIISDLANPNVPTPVARVQIGDLTENGGTDPAPYNTAGNEDALAIQQLARLPAPAPYVISGNHDVAFPVGTERGQVAFETAMGIPQSGGLGHRVVDLGFVKLLLMQQPRSSPANIGKMDQADIDWLDQQLTLAMPTECWCIHHYPLRDTVGGVQSGLAADQNVFSSFAPDATSFSVISSPGYAAGVDTGVRAVLGAHTNAKAWIAGHTHSPVDAPGFVMPLTLGSGPTQHVVASVNVSAVYYTRRNPQVYDPVKTVWVTKPSTGASRIEVRYRNHGASMWDSPGGLATSRVATVLL